jgi:hypothetical protein
MTPHPREPVLQAIRKVLAANPVHPASRRDLLRQYFADSDIDTVLQERRHENH